MQLITEIAVSTDDEQNEVPSQADDKHGGKSEKLLYCSFCGKSQHEVRKLIAGPSVFICDECVELCNDIILEEVDVGFRAQLKRRLTRTLIATHKQQWLFVWVLLTLLLLLQISILLLLWLRK